MASSIPIITPQEMYAAERAVIADGVPGFVLMQRAGAGISDAISDRYDSGRINILCGPGGNGGDGFVTAALLSKRGWDVRVFSLADLSDLKGDPKRAAELWAGPVYPLREALNAAANVTLDALFGGGLSRALTGVAAELADQSPGQIVAVDVPSGLPGATGQPLGPCFCADLTVTFAALRPAHVLMPGKGLCGVVKVVDIGVPVESRNVFRETKAPIPESALQLRDLAALGDALGEHVAVSENRIEAVRLLCSLHQRAVLLRSPEWILADDDQQVSVSNT